MHPAHRLVRIGYALGFAMLMTVRPAAAQQATPAHQPDRMSPEAAAYLTVALDSIQHLTLGADTLPWRRIRDSAFVHATGARKPGDTYGAINWALRRANRHGFLQAPRPGAVGQLVASRYGYIHVPSRGGAGQGLADSLHQAIRTLQHAGACGWIVDLRGNGGGNMWPMLAGIGPLLSDTIVGRAAAAGSADRWFYSDGVAGILRADGGLDTMSRISGDPVPMLDSTTPVALLIDSTTGSSGEAIAVAFVGRPHLHVLGGVTAGYATANRGSRLPDGANMVVTTGFFTDRTGREHRGAVRPDVFIETGPAGWPFPTDRAASRAADWLAEQRKCSPP